MDDMFTDAKSFNAMYKQLRITGVERGFIKPRVRAEELHCGSMNFCRGESCKCIAPHNKGQTTGTKKEKRRSRKWTKAKRTELLDPYLAKLIDESFRKRKALRAVKKGFKALGVQNSDTMSDTASVSSSVASAALSEYESNPDNKGKTRLEIEQAWNTHKSSNRTKHQ